MDLDGNNISNIALEQTPATGTQHDFGGYGTNFSPAAHNNRGNLRSSQVSMDHRPSTLGIKFSLAFGSQTVTESYSPLHSPAIAFPGSTTGTRFSLSA